MRSRYSAYACGDSDYLFRTWHPRTRPPDAAINVVGRESLLETITAKRKTWQAYLTQYEEYWSKTVHDELRLTDAQIADLQAGKWYFNVHTEKNKGGELRGQVVKKP